MFMVYVLLVFEGLLVLWTCCLATKRFFCSGSVKRRGILAACFTTARNYAGTTLQQIQDLTVSKDVKVRSLYNIRRIERVEYVFRLLPRVLALLFLIWEVTMPAPSFVRFGTFNATKPGDPRKNDGRHLNFITNVIPGVVSVAWAMLFNFRPQLLSARALDCIQITFAAMWGFEFAILPGWKASPEQMLVFTIWQVFIASLIGNALLATPLQMIMTAVQVLREFKFGEGELYPCRIMLLLVFLSFVWLMDLQTWREARATIRAQRADRGRAMVSRVLDSLCDAVVLLDDSLCIDAAGSTQLASMLMHSSACSTSPLQGVPLTDLVAGGCRERFQQFMARELAAARAGFGVHAPIASSLQIPLRGSLNMPVPVEIFCSCSLGDGGGGGGSCQYLVGIREQSSGRDVPAAPEQQPLPQLDEYCLEQSASADASTGGGCAPLVQRLGQIQEMDISSSDSDVSSECSKIHLEVSVWIDLDTSELALLHWTQGFAMLCQSSLPQGAGLLSMLSKTARQGFLAWVQAEAKEPSSSSREIKLQFPGQDGGNRRRTQRQSFACTVVHGAEDLLASPFPQGANFVRLDLHALSRQQQASPSALLAKCRNRATSKTTELWVEVGSKSILRSLHAPRSMFQVGSPLIVAEGTGSVAADDLLKRINLEMVASSIVEEWQPVALGTYTLVGGAYRVQADIEMKQWDDGTPENRRTRWCRLRLSNARLLGQHLQRSTVSI